MALKEGNVAIVKTTEEPVLVLAINPGQGEYAALSGTTVTVLRPVASETTGIQHVTCSFPIEALESQDERQERAYNEMVAIRGRFGSSSKPCLEGLPDLN